MDNLINNKERFIIEFSKFIHWTEKYDSILIYTIGHSNPLPDGDCVCSTMGFNAGLQYILQNKFKGNKSIKTRIFFNAKVNKYFNKIIEYINGVHNEDKIPSEFDYFSSSKLITSVLEEEFLNEIESDIKDEENNGNVGIAFFVLDTDYKRTGLESLLENAFMKINFICPNTINDKSQLFYGIIDHHIIKEGEDLVGFDSDNQLDLRFPSNSDNGASSTCEIICNLFSTFYLSLYKFKIFKEKETEYGYQIHQTLLKILMGGMRTDTGNFTFNGHHTGLRSISEYIHLYDLDAKAIEVDQNLIQAIVEPKKNISYSQIYAHLHNLVTNCEIGMETFEDEGKADFAYMIVDDYAYDTNSKISDFGIKPIHILQEYEWKAAMAITINNIDRTLSVELRSSEEKYDCRKLAQEIHPSGGGHLQAAGVTVNVSGTIKLEEVAESFKEQFIEYMTKIRDN